MIEGNHAAKSKRKHYAWRNEGLILYHPRFLCTLFMECQRTITILSSAKYIFETLMNYMVFNTLFSLALCEIFAMLVVVCNNTKLEKLQIIYFARVT